MAANIGRFLVVLCVALFGSSEKTKYNLKNRNSDMFWLFFRKPSSGCYLKWFLMYNEHRLKKYEISFT